ncbi:hypothetical protein GOBAR_AA25352 [Gossypium barbadense]|uniref:Uncharacterized protein n=1 Tax=Gossypium barbadense TaxID=3634 RepID=A0A2P5WW40_GOSBA|nr:hypothetical protein GOBAR_AA25352 [Gossypium barbadense]
MAKTRPGYNATAEEECPRARLPFIIWPPPLPLAPPPLPAPFPSTGDTIRARAMPMTMSIRIMLADFLADGSLVIFVIVVETSNAEALKIKGNVA